MSVVNSSTFETICRQGAIGAGDVLALRRQFYEDGHILQVEAEALFEINQRCPDQDPSWQAFLVEAITDYIVNDAEPQGYLTKANADWLIAKVTVDGKISLHTELEIVLNVLDKARWAPEDLGIFALEQVKEAVCASADPIDDGTDAARPTVTEADVALLRRILYAFGGDGNIAVTRREAEVLFEINDLTVDADNCPAWPELFVKAITSSVMAASGYRIPPRQEILKREAWLESRDDLSPLNLISKAFQGGFAGIFGAYQEQSAEERSLARLERQRLEIITNQQISEDEAAWLVERIGRDGQLSENEHALLLCIKQSGTKVAPELEPLLDRVEQAA